MLAYLKCTADFATSAVECKSDDVECYSDSDHAGDRKHGNTLSRTATMLMSNGMPHHWRSNKQPQKAQSSAAAEIVALSECVKDLQLRMWIARTQHLRFAARINFVQATGDNS